MLKSTNSIDFCKLLDAFFDETYKLSGKQCSIGERQKTAADSQIFFMCYIWADSV